MMFRDINQSSTMARSAYPDGNGELTDFNLFATKYDAGKPSIATDGLPSELSYQVRTAIRRAVDELGINVPEAAVVLKYPIHFYYSDASAELTGVLALPGAVAILALDGFVPKEQLAAPVIGDISRLRETVDELRRRGGLEPLPVRETIYTHTVPEGTVVANQRPAAYRATGRKKGTAMDQEKYDNEVSIKFPAKWCRVTDAQGKDIVIENGKKTETWPAVLCTIPTGTDMNGIDISGYKFKTFRKPWTESDIANGKGTTVSQEGHARPSVQVRRERPAQDPRCRPVRAVKGRQGRARGLQGQDERRGAQPAVPGRRSSRRRPRHRRAGRRRRAGRQALARARGLHNPYQKGARAPYRGRPSLSLDVMEYEKLHRAVERRGCAGRARPLRDRYARRLLLERA